MELILEEQLEKIKNYVPVEKMRSYLNAPLEFLNENITHIVPNVIFGGNGPVLSSVYIISANFLCEVQIPPDSNDSNFDIVLKKSVRNYRVSIREKHVPNDQVIKTFKVIELLLFHNQVESLISYVGIEEAEWTEWLSNARNALPPLHTLV